MSGNTKILITLSLVLVLAIVLASLGIAYAAGVRGTGLLGGCFFFTFGTIIVLAQVIPAGILLSSFINKAFSPLRRGNLPVQVN